MSENEPHIVHIPIATVPLEEPPILEKETPKKKRRRSTGGDSGGGVDEVGSLLLLNHLNTTNKNIVQDNDPKVSFGQLFQFASVSDIFLMIFGSLCAAVTGCSLPLVTIVFGNIIQSLDAYPNDHDKDALNTKVNSSVIYLGKFHTLIAGLTTIIASATFVCAYLQMALWSLSGQNQTVKIRRLYLQAVMRQEVAWFDENEIGSITSRLTDDVTLIRDGLGEKIATMVQFLTMFLAGYVIGFTHSWKLTMVMMATFPLMAGSAVWLSSAVSEGSAKTQAAYAKAGAIAQQVIAGVRTVVSFGREESEVARYNLHLDDAEKFGIRKGWDQGLGMGFLTGCMFLSHALGFWYGAILIYNGEMEATSVISVFFSVLLGAFALGQAGPGFTALSNARGAAVQIYKIINRKSSINYEDVSGQPLTEINHSIQFTDVTFSYPKRPDVSILDSFHLTIKAGQTVALVGSSGSGKSTIVKLVERFYDPAAGSIFIDGQDLKAFNVKSLRHAIAIVSQEPVLFDLTIRENILMGLQNDDVGSSEFSQQQLNSMVLEACRTANILEFVESLPHGINTSVGEAGSMMSGGQKQRIAIARAVIRNPLILLLDEATSALDTESERLVQKALENASVGRTTIVIAHRMSTIKNADVIVVMDKGKIVEMGSHDQLLLDNHSKYFELVQKQSLKTAAAPAVSSGSRRPSVIRGLNNHHSSIAHQFQSSPYSTPESFFSSTEKRMSVSVEKGEKEGGEGVKPVLAGTVLDLDHRPPESGSGSNKVYIAELQDSASLRGYTRLLTLAAPEWPWILVGCIAAALNGMANPSFALVLSQILSVFGKSGDSLLRDADSWAGMFVLVAIGVFVTHLLKDGCLRYAGEKLTRRLRENYLRSILHQNMSYFDYPEHATGAITASLADQISQIQTLTSTLLGSIIVMISSLTTGIVISFSQSWELSLVVIGIIPLIGISGAVQNKSLAGFGAIVSKAYAEVNQVATEAISEYRTILTLTKESHFIKRYTHESAAPHSASIRGGFLAAFSFGFAQCIQFFAFALALWYGTRMVIDDRIQPVQVLSVIFAIIFAAMAAGESTTFLPNISRSHLAAHEYFKLIDSVPSIDSRSKNGRTFGVSDTNQVKGEVGIKNAGFSYPARPDIVVWDGVSLEARQGKTVALVGKSGCGKSTAIAIAQRFYDVDSGNASFDEVDVKEWNLRFMRRQMALVGQEPVLFNTSIYDNIAYGLPIDVVCTAELVEGAARMANIHDFVTSLPQGYKTIVGEKGGQISGGQKQRIAIARALIRNPKVLLLDEATSALDSDSEKFVQEALDKAATGRTTIVIAHRLSTIQNADVIFVLDAGRVVEVGTHSQLVALGGIYAELANKQNLKH